MLRVGQAGRSQVEAGGGLRGNRILSRNFLRGTCFSCGKSVLCLEALDLQCNIACRPVTKRNSLHFGLELVLSP